MNKKLVYGKFIVEQEYHIGKIPVSTLLLSGGYRNLLGEFEKWLRHQYKFTKRPVNKNNTKILCKPGFRFEMEPTRFEVIHE